MINLITIECKKIFKKKSFLIVTVLFVLFALFTNTIYKDMNNYLSFDEYVDVMSLKERNEELDLTKKEELEEYVYNLSLIETEELKESYDGNTKKYLIEEYVSPLIEEKNTAKYYENDEARVEEISNTINNYLEKVKEGDWKYFTNIRLSFLNETYINATDDITKERYQELINLTNYRLANDVAYDESYLDNAINFLETNLFEYYNLKNDNNLTKDEETRLESLKEDYLINHYILEHKTDVNNEATIRGVMKDFNDNFGIFILIYLVMICGSIVSEEFNKGTIKYLLTKPYTRNKILTSKLLTVLILMPLIVIGMMLIELLLGGIMLGFDSLKVPVLLMNDSTVITMNVLKYSVLNLLSVSPMYLVLIILCFTLSTVTTSTSASITITFLFYLASNIIRNFVLWYNLKFLNWFVSIHWNFSYLVTGESNPFEIKAYISGIVISIYVIVMLLISYIYFHKKDVKNI